MCFLLAYSINLTRVPAGGLKENQTIISRTPVNLVTEWHIQVYEESGVLKL